MNFLSEILALLRRVLLAAVSLVLIAFFVAVGLVLSLVLLIWALVRGRKPAPMRFQWARGANGMPRWAPPGGARGQAPAGEVVDVQAREVPEVTPEPMPLPREGRIADSTGPRT